MSNTPANLLRSSGVAGELEPDAGVNPAGRDRESARNSLASAPVQSAQRGNGPILTSQAVLALQSTQQTGQTNANATADGSGDGGDGTGAPAQGQGAAIAANAAAAGLASGNPAQAQSGNGEKDDPDGDGLNEAEEKQVQELAKRDREVRAHEQAHARVGGAYAGAPSYTFQQGPDGKRYAVGGEVQIDTSKEKSPQETIRKMQIVIRAALAPAEPSSQDLKVAQLARSQLSEAQAESRQEKADELQGGDESPPGAVADSSESAPNGGDRKGDESRVGESGAQAQSAEAASAYRSAVQQASEAEALLASILA
ncbi:putative metalloprotease CJM1_0395 family protein [uncultured Roseibium sp.]|uniref:putative metalloprotease CJM1_0395 family protein n=1 Tax=uncultured Roseibium sp. TaxID=1936171 RepID=UPI0026110665|nr:putative metalloprotease CJM1_0395 family protein [uncultured Roseibium sp.]